MTTFLQATVEGLSLASIYSLVAIGFVLIYKSMDVLSFAQPALAVVGAGLISSLAVDRGVPFWLVRVTFNPNLPGSFCNRSKDILLRHSIRNDAGFLCQHLLTSNVRRRARRSFFSFSVVAIHNRAG